MVLYEWRERKRPHGRGAVGVRSDRSGGGGRELLPTAPPIGRKGGRKGPKESVRRGGEGVSDFGSLFFHFGFQLEVFFRSILHPTNLCGGLGKSPPDDRERNFLPSATPLVGARLILRPTYFAEVGENQPPMTRNEILCSRSSAINRKFLSHLFSLFSPNAR